MLNPISFAFKKAKQENRPALLTYTVAGDSTKKQSLEILKSISQNVDILEIGVPHNTPVADGSQIQTSSYRAIKNGIKVNDILEMMDNYKINSYIEEVFNIVSLTNKYFSDQKDFLQQTPSWLFSLSLLPLVIEEREHSVGLDR